MLDLSTTENMSLPLLQNEPTSFSATGKDNILKRAYLKVEIVASFIISLKMFLTQCYLHCKDMQGETDIIYQDEKNILTFVILAAW